MIQTIWKYELIHGKTTEVLMPMNATILSVANQRDRICIWALVDPNELTRKRLFKVFGTGHDVDVDKSNLRFIGSVMFDDGNFIFHVFEVIGG